MTQEIERNEKLGRAIVDLKGKQSEKYTKLAQKLERIQELEKEVKQTKAEIKSETKELIADLFTAEDIIYTRVVETVSVIFTLSKNPKPTESVAYKKVLDDLEKLLTPELVLKLEELKETYTSISEREPSLSFKPRVEFADSEQDIEQIAHQFMVHVAQWGREYSRHLKDLLSQLQMEENINHNPTKMLYENIFNSLKENDNNFQNLRRKTDELFNFVTNDGDIYKKIVYPLVQYSDWQSRKWEQAVNEGAKKFVKEFHIEEDDISYFPDIVRMQVVKQLKEYYQTD